jgi:DegV family protein with EDD domain
MIRIVTDGAADMPSDWAEAYDIQILTQGVYFQEKGIVEELDFSKCNFYEEVRDRKEVPKTAYQSPENVVDFYREIAHRGDTIISIHLASSLSGTYSAFQAAGNLVAGEFNVIAIDSGAGSAALGFMCREVRLLERAGATVQQIIDRMKEVSEQVAIAMTLDTLEFARYSGRVNAFQNAVASLLQVKPIIILQEGMLIMSEQVRTRKRSLDRVLDIITAHIGDKLFNFAIVHANDIDCGQVLLERVKSLFNCHEVIITELAIPVAAHLGPGTVGIVAYPVSSDLIAEDLAL